MPQLWFRDIWSWEPTTDPQPRLSAQDDGTVAIEHPELGAYWLYCADEPRVLFTENATNSERLFGTGNATPYVKDAFHAVICQHQIARANPAREGTKAAAWYHRDVPSGGTTTVELRLTDQMNDNPWQDFDDVFVLRKPKPMRSMQRSNLQHFPWTSVQCNDRHSPDCCGISNGTPTKSSAGLTATH